MYRYRCSFGRWSAPRTFLPLMDLVSTYNPPFSSHKVQNRTIKSIRDAISDVLRDKIDLSIVALVRLITRVHP